MSTKGKDDLVCFACSDCLSDISVIVGELSGPEVLVAELLSVCFALDALLQLDPQPLSVALVMRYLLSCSSPHPSTCYNHQHQSFSFASSSSYHTHLRLNKAEHFLIIHLPKQLLPSWSFDPPNKFP